MAYMSKEDRVVKERELIMRWDWLTEDIEEYDSKLNTSIVLENSYDKMVMEEQVGQGWLESTILNEAAINEAPTLSTAVGTNLIPKVLFPMIRRVFPTLIANKLVSVQPISGPTGVIYYIIYTFSDTKGNITSGDEYSALPQEQLPAYATFYSSEKIGPYTVTAATGSDDVITGGNTIKNFLGTDPTGFSLKRIEVYSATTPQMNAYATVMQAPSNGAPVFAGENNVCYDYTNGDIYLRDVADGKSAWTDGENLVVFLVYDQEASDKIPEMEFSIGSDTVQTTARQLKIRWTKESEQDMKSFHKLDVESELVKVASMEMNYEIDREIITFIGDSVIADLSFLHDWTADAPATGNNASGNFLDRHRALAQKVYQISAKIAQYNRQGPASWMVTSPQVAAVISMLPDFKGEIAGGTFNVFEAGKLGNGMQVFVDPNRHGALANEILLGYKSNTTTYGAGVVYSPYVNWMSNTVTHPDNFNSIRGFFSRYAIKLVPRGKYFYGKLQLMNFGI